MLISIEAPTTQKPAWQLKENSHPGPRSLLLAAAVGMAYVVVPELAADRIKEATFEIEIAKERFSAQASLMAFYDLSSSRMKI